MINPEIKIGIDVLFPPKAIGLPEEIATVACMVCSKDGSFINGEAIPISGGFPRPGIQRPHAGKL